MTMKKKINLLIGISFLLIQFFSVNSESIRDTKNVCETGNKIGVEGDCKKYKECENGTFVEKECEQTDTSGEDVFLFDIETKKCVSHFDPYKCYSTPTCEEGEKKGVVNDCTTYSECTNNTLTNKTCSDNYHFDALSLSCKIEGEAVCLCQKPPKRNCTEDEVNECGVGAICEVTDDKAQCLCKPGTSGDPLIQCCAKPLTCGCWGDPHCRTFDGQNFDFMGACKYDLVSTHCFNRTLAPGLVHFEIKQKHHTNGRKHSTVSFVEYVQVNVYGNRYRLLNGKKLTKNEERVNTPFNDKNNEGKGTVQVFVNGKRNLVLSTDFGLTVSFDGNAVKVTLCDAYEDSVCGLCGNADGNKTLENEFVDRDNVPVLDGSKHQYFKWGSTWKTESDDDRDRDIDQSLCSSNSSVGSISDQDECEKDYRKKEYCGYITYQNGPWKQCIDKMDKEKLDAIFEACVFDLCSYEGDSQQEALRCKIMNEFNKECLALSQELNRPWAFDWREKTKCPIECGKNEVYEVREECPKTCLHTDGKYDCGQKTRTEDCFCRDGYVMNEHEQCVKKEECDGKPVDCEKEENNCGVGAICKILGNQTQCTCPHKHKGDPLVRCCYKELSCSCWGDPHCHTFDKRSFDFQGSCKYDLISTDCHKPLKAGLVPFNVKQMHGTRGKNPKTSFVEYLEINVYGVQYRLIGNRNRFTRNGVRKSTPFAEADNKVQVYTRSKNIVLSTEFGLTVMFDEKHKQSVKLCDAYADNVCGLCGNADGNKDYENEFVDRENNPVALGKKKHSKYFKWGTAWIVPTDNSKDRDIDGELCSASVKDPIVEPPVIECLDNYEDSQNCGKLNSSSGTWSSCVEKMDVEQLTSLVEGCGLDLCAYENTTFQEELRCSAFEEFNKECLALAEQLGLPWDFKWREKTNCPMECGENEAYGQSEECPKTCLYPDGRYDCGSPVLLEGCYCKNGFVLNSFGKCVQVNECQLQDECKFEGDKSAIAGDCSKYQECNNGKLVNKTCTDVEYPNFDIVSNECKESDVATCAKEPVSQIVCKSTLDTYWNMTGHCTDVSLCVGAAVQGNCSSESICCIEDGEEAAMQKRNLHDDVLTKAVFLKVSGNTVRNAALYKYFVQAMTQASVKSTYAKAAFLAQMLDETNNFTSIESTIVEKDTNADIGNNETGDGRKFRGRGAILIRGKANYKLAQDKSNLDLPYNVFEEPETVAYPSVAFPLAAWFWNSNAYPVTKANEPVNKTTDLNELADGSFMGFTQITHALTNHLSSLKKRAALNEEILQEIGFAPLVRGSGETCTLKSDEQGRAVPICLLDFKRAYCGCEGKYEVRSCPYGRDAKNQCRNSATIKCCAEKVDCKTFLDLVILIDSSSSVNADNFNLVKTFTKDLVRNQDVGLNKTRISIINYSRNAKVVNSLNEGTTKEALNKFIDSLEFLNKSTNTAEALRFANEQLNETKGMRHKRNGMPRVVVTITDGLSNVDKDLTIPEANKLKKREINLISVGIGPEIGNNSTELFELASSAYDMIYVPDFEKLNSILNELTTKTCQQAAPLYQGEEAAVQQVQQEAYKYFTYKVDKQERSVVESYYQIKLRVLAGDAELYWSFDESDKNPKNVSEYMGPEIYAETDIGNESNYIPEKKAATKNQHRAARSVGSDTVKSYEAVDPSNRGTLYITVKGLAVSPNEFEISVESRERVINSGQCLSSGNAFLFTLFLTIFTLSFRF